MKTVPTALLAVLLLSPSTAAFTLAADGKAAMPIIVAERAGDTVRGVADELAEYLRRITGAEFPIRTGSGAHGLVLGTLADFPDPSLNEALQIRNTCDGREAYAIRTDADRIRLIGATDLAVSHAAFRLLEHIGCRWFFPAKEWEIIPSRPMLVVDLNETDRPAILSRRIWWGYGFFNRQEKRCQSDYEVWARHNRMASSRQIRCGHAWQSIIADNKAVFDVHPEYLALVDGQRRGPQLCVSNAAVRTIAAAWALNQFKKNPTLDMVSMETSDGSDHCQCADCASMGSISDRAFGLANEVARHVAKDFPGKMIGMLAYNDHCEPPSFKLEPNVYVQSTAGFIRGRYTFDELMELWPAFCSNTGFYEYLSVWLWDFDMPPGGNGANLKHIQQRIRRYAEVGATSIDCESGNNWGPHGLGYYLANKLMWNPEADTDALLADFYEKAFGPAAGAVQRYYERLDKGNGPLISEHLLALSLRDLDEASRLAANRPDIQARLDHLKQYQHYVRLRWEYDRAGDMDAKRTLALQIFTHVYRTRYSYMNHWAAMLYDWTPKAAAEFDEPTWSFREPSNPWKIDTPCTHEETDAAFRQDMLRFQPQTVEERTFSRDLVRAGLVSPSPVASSQKYQGKARYAFCSTDGEPLNCVITTGLIAWYRDRPDAGFVLTDAQGNELHKGRLPQDGNELPLTLNVPRPGIYWLEVDDQAAGWGIRASAGAPVCLALQRASSPSHMGHMQPMYFYVPAGTQQIHYYWKGGPHEVYGPDGVLLHQTETSGRFITIDVPPGADAKAWSIRKLALGHLWFFNIPNYLAASPDALLIPTDALAKTDRPDKQ
ncbi:MAG: DUF4838 domain-containing protein [Phycisphaerae bacterium]|nr:DUF4838 domain-containing protein [Phycisphaerae bacterium]